MIRKSSIFFLSLLFLALAASPAPAQNAAVDCAVVIEEPHSGQVMPNRIAVAGTATLPPGHHLWVFDRRFDFEPDWWIQGEATVDPQTHQWRRFATLGGDNDIGWDFDLTAAVVGPAEHQVLAAHFSQDINDKNYRPLVMPRAACVAPTLRVTRR